MNANQLFEFESVAVELAGMPGRWVRASDLRRVLGVLPGIPNQWEAEGWLVAHREACPRSLEAPRGIRVWYPLASMALAARRLGERSMRKWTEAEWARAAQLLGDLVPLSKVARFLGRTEQSIRSYMLRLGVTIWDLMRRRGWLMMRDLARLLRKSIDAVQAWAVRYGLPVRHRRGGNRERVCRLPAVRAWIMGRWGVAVNLEPEVLAMLRLRLEGGRVLNLEK